MGEVRGDVIFLRDEFWLRDVGVVLEGGECKVGIKVFAVGQEELNRGDEFLVSVIRLEGDGPFDEGLAVCVYVDLLGLAECACDVSGVRFMGGGGALGFLL
jgi:hypothetical protein